MRDWGVGFGGGRRRRSRGLGEWGGTEFSVSNNRQTQTWTYVWVNVV